MTAFDTRPAVELEPLLTELSCSPGWAAEMIAARPHRTRDALHRAAAKILAGQSDDEIVDAVRAHPPIGGRTAAGSASSREQRAAATGDPVLAERLAIRQRDYAERFGRPFLVCATGLDAAAIAEEIDRRLALDPERDLAATREHLRRINELRLDRLLDTGRP